MKIKSSTQSDNNSKNFVIAGMSKRHRIIIWGFLSTLILVTLFVLKPTLLQPLDFMNYDLLLKHFPKNYGSNRPVIVALDEKSLNQYGQWPWPRYRVAELFDKITALNPSVIALDMLFAEPDRTSAKHFFKDFADSYHLNLSVNGLPGKLSDNDLILAETMARGPFILGNKFHFNKFQKNSEQCVLHPVKISVLQNTKSSKEGGGIPESVGVLCNLKIFSEMVDSSGFFNFSPDKDGMLRRLPLLIKFNGEIYTSLALAAVLKFKKKDNLILKKEGNILTTINFQKTSVPVDPYGQLLIKFRGPAMYYNHISAADIIDGTVSPDKIREKIVFVGATAVGLKELRTTPFDPIFPGVEVHATVADNLLSADFISIPEWSNGLALLFVFFIGISLAVLIAFKRATTNFIIMLLFVFGLWFAGQQTFFRTGLFIATAFPIASVLCNYIFLSLLKYRLEEKKLISGMQELLLTQDITIESMANMSEYRDPEISGHIERTRRYVKLLAGHIKYHEKYKHFLTDENIEMLYKSAPLHDIGKIGIPDNILLKAGRLTEEEFEIMKTHTNMGYEIIESSMHKLGKKSFLAIAAEIVRSHQEKWDGSGYPQGLKGEEIPISGRLMAIADVYDALISKRIYKPAYSHAMSVEIIKKAKGTYFDPDMVDAFIEIHEQFKEIAVKFNDFSKDQENLMKDLTAGELVDIETLSARE